jgi:SAM-dependent methyltransferase
VNEPGQAEAALIKVSPGSSSPGAPRLTRSAASRKFGTMQKKKFLSKLDKKITEEVYTFCLKENLADGWAGKDKYENFQNLIEITKRTAHPLKGASVLDVGCGTGDLVAFLHKYEIGEYLGVDLVKPSIELARQKYPGHEFKIADFLKVQLRHRYDFVFASGAISMALETDNYAVMEAFIDKMWKSAQVGVAFNFITPKKPGQKDDTLFLYDLDRVLESCRKVAPRAVLEHQMNEAGYNGIFLQAHVYLCRGS